MSALYHPHIDQYLDYIKNNKHEMCEEQLALHDFLHDNLKNATIDAETINKHIGLIEQYFFKLLPMQKCFFALTDGVYDSDGLLLFNEYLLMGGRGMGKNGSLSGESLYLLSNRHGIPKYDVNIIATSEDQAKTSFEEVYDAIGMNGELKRAVNMTKEKIVFRNTGATLKYMTSNPKTKDGGRPGAVAFDEIHAYEDYEQVKVHVGGLGKIDKPRRYYLTTDGYVRGGFLDETKERSHDVLFRGAEHNGLLPFIFKLDKEEEVHNPENWIKANPRIKASKVLLQEMKKQYQIAKNSDGQLADFLTKRMNIPRMPELEVVATHDEIQSAKRDYDVDLRGLPCIGAIDYASMKDFCSVGLIFYTNGKVYVKQHSFVHRSAMNRNYKFPIQEAVNHGLITVVDSPAISGEQVLQWFIDQASDYVITDIVADEYRFGALREAFENAGIELKGIRSGYVTHSKLYPLVTQLFAENRIVFGNDFLMSWYCGNVTVKTDNKGNKTYLKIEPILRKTDGFFMLLAGLTQFESLQGDSSMYVEDIIM